MPSQIPEVDEEQEVDKSEKVETHRRQIATEDIYSQGLQGSDCLASSPDRSQDTESKITVKDPTDYDNYVRNFSVTSSTGDKLRKRTIQNN